MLLAMFLVAAACSSRSRPDLRIVMTTSVEPLALPAELIRAFEKETGLKVQVQFAGTATALEIVRRGDADGALVHDPEQEEAFMKDGHAASHVIVGYSEYVVLGPPGDPARVRQATSPADAMARIAAARAEFISRGDRSGTHIFERDLWKSAKITPAGAWYLESGRGMSETLMMAMERGAYVISVLPSWLHFSAHSSYGREHRGRLEMLYRKTPQMNNRYAFLAGREEATSAPAARAAGRFSLFLTSPTAQELWRNHAVGGERAFRSADNP